MSKYSAINTDEEITPQASNSDALELETTDQTPLLNTSIEDENQTSVNYASASRFSCAVNLANTILGTGMLAMPAAVASVGLIMGSMMIFFAAFTSGLGLFFLSRGAFYTKGRSSSFFAVSQLTYPKAALFFDIAIAVKCFGVSISYLIIIGDLMPQVVIAILGNGYIDSHSLFLDRRFWITASMIIIVPLAFLKRLDSLKHTSIIALIAVVYLMFIVIYHYFGPDFEAPPKDKIHLINFSGKFFANLPIFVFSFTCHQNVFSVCNELKNNAQNRVNSVIFVSIGTSAIVYQIIGILGYLSFGDDVWPNIIAMYRASTFITIGRIAIVILVIFSYPLQAHPARACLEKSLISLQSLSSKSQPSSSEARYIFLTVAILLSSYTISILVSKLDLILSFVGSTGSTAVSFILPGIFYYKLHEDRPWNYRKILSVFLTIYGLSVMCICLTMNIIRVIYGY
ncbi:vacuolar amino acid transporter 5 [Gigaspora margarita]|uniref:Vacuolar amino acid transporter 5 n=1 Tax=Gigaspora margarita TaxID=4874 RepID=A0A8H4A2M0_GIGMA|nr:vacuolar amino acid transporter 5 [Gigaspora margarita]